METVESISARAFMEEKEAVHVLLAHVKKLPVAEKDILARASAWIDGMREHSNGHGIEAFLNTYGLNTTEGVALMCLAEALLRIPDAETADALIRGTFEGKHWKDYTGSGDSWLMHLSSLGLMLTGEIIDYGKDAEVGVLHVVKTLAHRMGEPLIRKALKQAMVLLGGQFVLGETASDALQKSRTHLKKGYRFSYDILGEGARSQTQVDAYMEAYREGIALIGKTAEDTSLFEAPGISVKLSALHARYQLTKRDRVMSELLPRLKEIARCAKNAHLTLAIDAEESSRLDIEMLVFEQLLSDPAFAKWNGIGFVVQAYQKRAFYIIDWLASLARKHKRIIPVRLVKGAYWDSEIKWAQTQGLTGYPVFTRKEYTDVSYLACADKLLSARDIFYPQFATHNARTAASIMLLAKHYSHKKGSYEFQRLFGMGEALHDALITDIPSRIYAPVGTHKDLLAYLIRRLLENGANTSFVHLLMDRSKTAKEILADPVAVTASRPELANPTIPLPTELFGGARKNSLGLDFGNLAQLNTLSKSTGTYVKKNLPAVKDITDKALSGAIAAAQKAFPTWAATPVETRAAALERTADLLEKNKTEFMALCAREAGRTLNDGLAEVREAIDFCRYYAAEARTLFASESFMGPAGESNVLTFHPRGVFACISPWNFPLSIFMGQISAALVAGNTVVAKPAEQTPRIAERAVALLHEAGIPKNVLHLAAGKGETVGASLVTDERVDGVVFTGGTETARHIARSLAARSGALIPFVAETGGQNCMVVDSSALLEQAVDDIILSAFGSAGQRCSSLRVLFVQEDIADELLTLLSGAMQELILGDPLDPCTDIGPVIDEGAKKMLFVHITEMKKSAKFIASAALPKLSGHFVAPHVFEIKDIKQLKKEVFGPILHVVRFPAKKLPQLPDIINSTGFGLTFGIHSRIDEHIRLFTAAVRAGNIYVNRSMIGATVGVQPFGGERLSGTGPKAGGPHYLLRFVTERVTTVNTAAIGGNISLLAT